MPRLCDRFLQMKKKRFSEDDNVFGESKKDDKVQQQRMIDHDFKKWQISRIVDSSDVNKVTTVVRENFKKLRDIYQMLAAVSEAYPFVSYPVFLEFIKAIGIIEDATEKILQELKGRTDMTENSITNIMGMSVNKTFSKFAKPKKNYKPSYASFTEGQASMAFAMAIYDREDLVKDEHVPLHITDLDERKEMVQKMQIEKLIEFPIKAVLNRCQFMEVFVRIAMQKYHESDVEMPI